MDINELYTVEACEKGAELQIVNPITGEKTDCYIEVMGVDSKAFREAKRQSQRKAVEVAKKEDSSLDVDEITAGMLADVTVGWRGFTSKGKAVKFSKKAAKELYANSPDIANQVDLFMSKRANFTKG